jgi:hypothetical protein
MKEREALPSLIGEIEKHKAVLLKMSVFFAEFRNKHPDWKSIDTETAMGAAQFFGNFYTCAETIFFRISSFFENNLEKQRWHSHLLDRMTCDIPGERPHVLENTTAVMLADFLKFRHFTRYYFDFDYDREKLEFLGSRFERTLTRCINEVDTFCSFLSQLKNN